MMPNPKSNRIVRRANPKSDLFLYPKPLPMSPQFSKTGFSKTKRPDAVKLLDLALRETFGNPDDKDFDIPELRF